MKKEKTIKTYQRRTKSGKVVTVKQHTAKYDAADKAKEMASKKGAGEELAAKKGMPDHNLPMNEYLAELKKMREKPEETPMEQETKKSSPSAEKKSKSVKSTKSTKNAATTQANGVSASDFKSWYHFNDWDKPKKSWPAEVRAADAAIRKQLGSKKAYDDYCAQIDGSYSKRGHNTAFTSFGNLAKGNLKRAVAEGKITQAKADAIMGKKPTTSAELKKSYEAALAKEKKDKLSKNRKEARALYAEHNTSHREVAAFMKAYSPKRGWSWDRNSNSFVTSRMPNGLPMRGFSEMSLATAIKKMEATRFRERGGTFAVENPSKAKPTKGGKFISQAETTKLVNSAINKAKRAHQRDLSGLFEDSILNKIPKDKLKNLSPDRVWNALDAANMRYQKRRNKYDPSYRAETYKLDNISKYLSKFSDDKGAAKKNGQAGPAQLRKASPSTKALTSSQKHAINTLLSQPGWTMSKAEKYVRSLSPKEVMKIRRNE